jgi:hypothetical protein
MVFMYPPDVVGEHDGHTIFYSNDTMKLGCLVGTLTSWILKKQEGTHPSWKMMNVTLRRHTMGGTTLWEMTSDVVLAIWISFSP